MWGNNQFGATMALWKPLVVSMCYEDDFVRFSISTYIFLQCAPTSKARNSLEWNTRAHKKIDLVFHYYSHLRNRSRISLLFLSQNQLTTCIHVRQNCPIEIEGLSLSQNQSKSMCMPPLQGTTHLRSSFSHLSSASTSYASVNLRH